MSKTFVLGIGAQRAGTTWLHNYISSYEKANLGFTKEYHIWNVVHFDYPDINKAKEIPFSKAFTENLDRNQYLRFCMMNVPGFYEEYFNSILNNGFEITGDITPCYAFLKPEHYYDLREKFYNLGIDIRVVFIMRDPFERCLSSARMQRKKPNSWKSDAEALKDRYDGLGNQLRTQYEHTVENLKQVFTPDELYFGIYENMFQSTELKNLSDFLGIPFNKSLVDVRLNESRLIEDIPIELKAEVKEFYSNTYEYCYKNFTETKCLWL
jgi:hypothetical protein